MNLLPRAANPEGTHDRGSSEVSTCDLAWRRLMNHAILGAGAIGGLVGAVLAHEGEDVRLLVRPEKQSGYSGKLKLNTPKGAME